MLLPKEYTAEFVLRLYLIAAFILVVFIQKTWLLIALAVPVLLFLLYAIFKKSVNVKTEEEL